MESVFILVHWKKKRNPVLCFYDFCHTNLQSDGWVNKDPGKREGNTDAAWWSLTIAKIDGRMLLHTLQTERRQIQ